MTLSIVAADISSAQKIVFRTVNLADSIVAITFKTRVFMPARVNGRML